MPGAGSLWRVDLHSRPIRVSPETGTVFIGPAGAKPSASDAEVYDPDGSWELLHPAVPDAPPLDGQDGDG
jgi:hypothetical protein